MTDRWPKEDERRIVELWEKGLTGLQIAREMRLTRSAILGKISRMRKNGVQFKRDYLPKEERIANPKLRKAPHPKPLSKTKTIRLAYIPKAADIKPPEPMPKPSDHSGNGLPFSQLSRNMCRFVVSGRIPPDYKFCGDPIHMRSFCEHHYKICYGPRSLANGTAAT